ncbi:MAG: hypothetical protein V1772_08440 [Chloroflexota bacterium]
MDDPLRRVQLWASHGTPRQLMHELAAKLSDQPYRVEEKRGVVTVSRVTREGGFLGIGARQRKQVLLQVTYKGDEILLSPEQPDAALVQFLSEQLKQH